MSAVELVTSGYHNGDLARSTARVIETGTWKRQRVIVIMPAADTIPTRVALAHWSLAFPPNQSVHRMLAVGCEVGDAYSTAISEIVAHPELSQWEYILTIEHDNMPPPDGLVRLIKRMETHPEYSCIGGLYWCKGPDGCAHIWGDPTDPVLNFRPQPPRANELVECCGTSMGFNLWRMSLFKDERLRRPWFKTLDGSEGIGIGTQDLYFWGDARKYGYRCAVDCGVLVGHHDHSGAFGVKGFTW
jgi:hypothetical protein